MFYVAADLRELIYSLPDGKHRGMASAFLNVARGAGRKKLHFSVGKEPTTPPRWWPRTPGFPAWGPSSDYSQEDAVMICELIHQMAIEGKHGFTVETLQLVGSRRMFRYELLFSDICVLQWAEHRRDAVARPAQPA